MRNTMTRWMGTSAMLMICVFVTLGSMGCGGLPITVIIDDTETCIEQDIFDEVCVLEDVIVEECFDQEVIVEVCDDFFGVLICTEELVIETVCEDFIETIETCVDIFVETILVCG